jgi:hypothetical protein
LRVAPNFVGDCCGPAPVVAHLGLKCFAFVGLKPLQQFLNAVWVPHYPVELDVFRQAHDVPYRVLTLRELGAKFPFTLGRLCRAVSALGQFGLSLSSSRRHAFEQNTSPAVSLPQFAHFRAFGCATVTARL